jgi:hypothetical protein
MARPSKANGRRIKCTVMVSWYGKMGRSMKATLSMINERGKGSSHGKMEEYMMACGRMENNMGGASLYLKMELRGSENGKTEKR